MQNMPPKPKKDARSAKLEAERKAKEEEEARIQAEKEEQERKEQEKRDASQRLLRDNEECKLRKVQFAELDSLYRSLDQQLLQEKVLKRTEDKWARYMKCDGSPDPTILPSINMYMSLWREDKNTDFKTILSEAELVLKLINELNQIIDDSVDDPEVDESKRDQYRNTIVELELLLQEKLDLGTLGVLSKATALASHDTGNLEFCSGNSAITLCVWGNLSKNPRIKSYEFMEKGLFFEIPKVLTLTDCGVRALFTKFDNLSQQSSSYRPKIIEKIPAIASPAVSPVATEVVIDINASRDDEEEEEEEQTSGRESETLDKDDEDKDVMDILKKLQAGEDADEQEEREGQGSPTSLHSMKSYVESDYVIITPEPVDYDDFDGDEQAVDLRAFQVVGGVVHFNLLKMPPQPKQTKSWTVTQLVEPPELEHLNYVADVPKPLTAEPSAEDASRASGEDNGKSKSDAKVDTEKTDSKISSRDSKSEVKTDEEESDEVRERKGIEGAPILITLKLPEDVYFCEEPQLVRWDEEHKQWRTDGFLDKMYTEATRLLTFRTLQFGTLAVIQDTHVNMPFQSWELRPRDTNHAQLTIIAAVVEVEIQIKEGLVCLSQPANRPELAHLINSWMSVPDLITKMRLAGVNVFPAEDSFKYVNIPDKNVAAEFRFYRHMALVASAMAFSWSRWNTDINDRERIIVQAAEHLTDEQLLEDQWWMSMITKKRCDRLKMSEYDEAFNDEIVNTEFYADVYHAARSMTSDAAIERIDNTSKNFVDAAYRLLSATRVITYA